MGSDGVSEVRAGAGERVGGMVNGQVLHRGLLQGQEPVGIETCVHNELAEVGGFVRRSWVKGSEERMWKPFLRICLRR